MSSETSKYSVIFTLSFNIIFSFDILRIAILMFLLANSNGAILGSASIGYFFCILVICYCMVDPVGDTL